MATADKIGDTYIEWITSDQEPVTDAGSQAKPNFAVAGRGGTRTMSLPFF
jgi:hypothetical protein